VRGKGKERYGLCRGRKQETDRGDWTRRPIMRMGSNGKDGILVWDGGLVPEETRRVLSGETPYMREQSAGWLSVNRRLTILFSVSR